MNTPQPDPRHWRLLRSELAFDHRWMKVRRDAVRLPDGSVRDDFFVWLCGDVSLVVPIDADGRFVLAEQYKHAAGEVTLEFPAGMVDEGETAEEAAARELLEETGYAAAELEPLGKLTDHPTKAVGNLHVFLARGPRLVSQPDGDGQEDIRVRLLDRGELEAAIREGRIRVSGTIAAAYLALARLG